MRRAVRAIALAFAILSTFVIPSLAATAAGSRDDGYSTAMELGMRHFYARAFDAARADFEEAHRRNPRDPLADTFYVASSVRAGEHLETLVSELEERAALAPTDDAEQALLGFAELFPRRDGADLSARARLAFERAQALAPSSAAPRVGLGILAFNRHAAVEAKREFLAALQSDPLDVLAREYLAQLDLIYLKESLAAIAVLIDVTNIVPGYADAYYHLGEAALEAGRYDLAARFLEHCLRLDPHGVGEGGRYGRTLLAHAYENEGRVEDARRVRLEGERNE